MILLRDYDKDGKIDRIWYKSSNIVYSECDDNTDSLKTLRVTFKNGATYEYYEVDVQDYVMFVHGGLDGSNGKALNKFVKAKKYEYKRIEDKVIEDLQKEYDKKIQEKQEQKNNEKENPTEK